MEKYNLLSTVTDVITRKMELVGYNGCNVTITDAVALLEGEGKDTIIIENCILDSAFVERIKGEGKYEFCIDYKGHTIFTNDNFIQHLIGVSFKPRSIQYYDNFPEAKIDLAKFFLPAIIRPYGVSDINYIYLVRDYSKGIEAIYDSLEKSPHRHVIIESYI